MTQSPKNPWLILLGLTLGVCITNGFARFAYGLILPPMRADLGLTYAQAGWINTANALGYILGAMGTLALSYRIEPSRLFSIGMVGTCVFLAATGLTRNLDILSVWRILTGVFGAMAFITGGALSAALFPASPRATTRAIGIYFGVGGGLGMVLTGALLPALFAQYPPQIWPRAWQAMGLISMACLPLCLWSATQLRPPSKSPEAGGTLPLKRILPELSSYFCFGLGYIVYITFIVAWMRKDFSGAPLTSALWITMGFGVMASPFIWQNTMAKHSSGRPLALVMAVLALGNLLPLLAPSVVGLIASAALFGAGVFMAPGAVTSFSRQNLAPAVWGRGISLFTLVFAIGQTLGPVAAGALGDLTGDISHSLMISGAILALGAGLASLQAPLK